MNLEHLPEWLSQIHVASTLYMVGLIWFVQVVHYPLFALAKGDEFENYIRTNMRLTSWVVILPMVAEGGSAIALFWFRPAGISTELLSAGLGLLVVIWASTFLLQVPCHERLANGFDPEVHRRLVRTNWIRTIAWSLRGILVLTMK
ncbi:hypothetical protein KIH39_16095 [Telmatocola sphagniphila]|uniref:Uncharacterized protein n=1 Tax=Telmatocola sphagniphila TaxID=1123043 RepID=A0A8E6ETP6_9BACT|nr:hypothetical protein [Telmatocola sphagniphila]QVL30370.1 hypothetical protein KIH39_16095 [Telmatocola sphagniphila]